MVDRTQELNYFFRYLIINSHKFITCLTPISIFLNPQLCDDQVTAEFDKFKEMEYYDLLGFYKQIVHSAYQTTQRKQTREKIEIYQKNLMISLEFYEVNLAENNPKNQPNSTIFKFKRNEHFPI